MVRLEPVVADRADLAAGGVIAGLTLLVRGLVEYRSSFRVGDTSTSTIGSLAAGEVRISGVIEPAEMTLVSLLQGASCVFYRSTVGRGGQYLYLLFFCSLYNNMLN